MEFSIAAVLASPILAAAVKLIICLVLAKVVLGVAEAAVNKMNVEPTVHKFMRSVTKAVILGIAILTVASTLGFDVTSVVALVSVVSAAFALAAQNTLANFFGGVLLMLSQPFRVGEYIHTAAGDGTVQEVGLMNTVLKTPDNRVVTVPNGTIVSGTIDNYSREETRRLDLDFSVSYENDIDHVYAVINKTIDAHPLVLREPDEPFVRVTAYADSSVTYTVRVWCKGEDYWTLRFDLLEGIKKAFDKTGISIPYNHINVHMIEDK